MHIQLLRFLSGSSLSLLVIGQVGCQPEVESPTLPVSAEQISNRIGAAEIDVQSEAAQEPSEAIARFCGDCHALPPVDAFERDVWYEEIRKGYEFYAKSGRSDLKPPPAEEVIKYYRKHAPAKLDFPPGQDADDALQDLFYAQRLDWQDRVYVTPAISSISWLNLMGDDEYHLVVSDMRDGSVSLVSPGPEKTSRRVIGRMGHPARVHMCDLNQDGLQDLLVADLGSFNPYDHGLGQVVWLKRKSDSLDFEQITLARGFGRISDVTTLDLGNDGSMDIVFSEFGHRQKGSVSALINRTQESDKQMQFQMVAIDSRPGVIRLLVNDWNLDGKQDLACVFSQEYESVELFLNSDQASRGILDRVPIWSADNLAYGSCGIELADMDGDGDQDIIVVNGDCFDNNYANLSHGIQWLENEGNLDFQVHRIGDLLGAYRAIGCDIDRDGDQDVLVSANLPYAIKPASLRDRKNEAVVVFEQREGAFVKRVLMNGGPRYPALEVADMDRDGALDFVLGAQLFGNDPIESDTSKLPRLTIWWQDKQ